MSMHIYAGPAAWPAPSMHICAGPAEWPAQSMRIYAGPAAWPVPSMHIYSGPAEWPAQSMRIYSGPGSMACTIYAHLIRRVEVSSIRTVIRVRSYLASFFPPRFSGTIDKSCVVALIIITIVSLISLSRFKIVLK